MTIRLVEKRKYKAKRPQALIASGLQANISKRQTDSEHDFFRSVNPLLFPGRHGRRGQFKYGLRRCNGLFVLAQLLERILELRPCR